MRPLTRYLLSSLPLLLIACQDTGDIQPVDDEGEGEDTDDGDTGLTPIPAEAHASCGEDSGIIQPTPSEYGPFINKGFDRYAEVIAPNGEPIRIFAQDEISEAQIIRARNLLRFFLTNVEGSTWGKDKSDVAESMADHMAILLMINGYDGSGPEVNLPGQYLFDEETPVEGSKWFMKNNYNHRDAAFEEIFHLVHDLGVGTYVNGARPDYQADLLAEAEAALDDGRWGIPVDPGINQWINELRAENSLAQEYIASVIDSYYGLWGPWDEADGGMWGIYIAKTRDEIATLDPRGAELLEQFLSPTLTYEIRLDSALDQDFDLNFDESKPYTHKSRYMLNVTLTGSNPMGIIGNEKDNTLRGNTADNLLDGSSGDDTVVYCHPASSYTVTPDSTGHAVSGPDGTDSLRNIEFIHFADSLLPLSP